MSSPLARLAVAVAGAGVLRLTVAGLRRARNGGSPQRSDGQGVPAPSAPAAPPSDAYRLLDAPLAGEIRRVARGRVDHARAELSGRTGHEPARAVHEARKDIKRLRSLLRLVRDDLGERTYRRENDWLRETAQGLAGARDAEVLAVTLEELVGDGVAAEAVAALRSGLQEARRRAAGDPRPAMALADQRLDELRRRIDSWPLRGDHGALAAGLRRSYARGRRRGERSRRDPSVDGLHEWRKRVKDLWYQAALLRHADPGTMREAADAAHELSALLGDDHDLGLLGEAAAGCGFLFAAPEDQRSLLAAVQRRRDELQVRAFAIAERLYGPRPRAFVAGVGEWSTRAAGAGAPSG